MKSPMDIDVEPLQAPGAAAAARSALPPKPAGGKALMRMVTLLDRRGFHDLADQAIASKTDESAHEQVSAARDQMSVAPRHLVTGVEGKAKAPAARDAVSSDAAAIAELYAASAPNSDAAVPATAAPRSAETAAPAGPPTSPPTATGPQWQSLGPWTVPNGQTYGSSRVNISGRVSSIAVHPTNPARVLCGAANGGVWESSDRGASWAPRTDYATTLAVGALAYDRTNPNNVYCGLGEGNWWSWLGNGILRSTNGGTTWAPLCTAPFVGQGFYDLQVSQTDGQRIVAATNGGLYVSSNGGVAWTQRRNRATWSVAIAPGPVASAEMLAACSDGVYRSADGGTTWAAVAIAGAGVAAVIAVAGGEAVSATLAFGIVTAAVGASLACASPGERTSAGAGWAILAGLQFGVMLTLFGATGELGAFTAVSVARLTALVVLVPVLLSRRRPPTPRVVLRTIAVCGLVDALAFGAFAAAATRGPVSVASVCAAQFSTVSVIVAIVRAAGAAGQGQLAGIALTLVGTTVLAAV